jgi:hypothetical protein
VALAIASSLVWFSLTILAGLALAAGKCSYELADRLGPTTFTGALVHGLRAIAGYVAKFNTISAMHAHAHLGGIGFFLMLIVGVSYRLVPMFAVGEIQNHRRAAVSVWLLNFGLAGLFPGILLNRPWKLVFALLVLAGLVVYFIELVAILSARQRRHLDWGMRYLLTALGILAVCGALGLVLGWPGLQLDARFSQLENLYGFLFFVGVVGFAIAGMLYKIIPFLVWYARYSSEIGRARVPALADLYSPRLQAAGYWTFLAGLLASGIAIVAGNEAAMPWCTGLLGVSLIIFAVNAARILSHLFHPKLQPLTVPI